ncbi:SDR family oxidoreductase [Oligoflexus tunisiensis]|uniref:SDR family oxidoreductase n=1 Tax=Oligoflexus tunisiensis TaxID=708132 RepID=UPI000AD32E52|nr:SDR family oxidoreductase [Oligoflexus tunisiensis]
MQFNNSEMENERPTPPFPARKIPKPGLEKDLEPRPQYEGLEYRGSGKLEGKVALITGGDSGIGRAVAVHYAKEGADVAIVHLPEEQDDAEETLQAVRALGRGAISIPGDVGDPEFCRQAVKSTVKTWGHLDILVNNAARQKHIENIEDLDEKEFEHTFRTNIFGYFYMAKAAIPELPEGGCIINCGSITGLEGSAALLDYSATKGAIHAFTKSLAKNLVKRKIRVNCVAPGPVWTPLNPAELKPEATAHFGESTPYGRPAQPEEIAPAFVFFASSIDSSYITGEVLSLLGGDTTAG